MLENRDNRSFDLQITHDISADAIMQKQTDNHILSPDIGNKPNKEQMRKSHGFLNNGLKNLDIPQMIPEANSDSSSDKGNSPKITRSADKIGGSVSKSQNDQEKYGLIEERDETEPTLIDGQDIDELQKLRQDS